MITSYLSPEGSLLYLSLVGRLDRNSADDLVSEYEARKSPTTRRCILDLRGTDDCDAGGLAALRKLSLLTRDDDLTFGVTAEGSPSAEIVRRQAGTHWVSTISGLPLGA